MSNATRAVRPENAVGPLSALVFLCLVPAISSSHLPLESEPTVQHDLMHDEAADTDARADRLFHSYFEDYLQLFPRYATFVGDYRFDDQLEIEISEAHRDRQKALVDKYLSLLDGIDAHELSPDRALSSRILRYKLKDERKLLAYPAHLMPINSIECFPDEFATLGSGDGDHRFSTVTDFRNFMSRMRRFPVWVNTAIWNMRKGVEHDYVLPQVVTEKTIELIATHAVTNVDDSVFLIPLAQLPSTLSEDARENLVNEYRQTVANYVIPSYRRLETYLREEYLGQSRTSVSWYALPDGEAWYRDLVRSWTTVNTSPEDLHQLGLAEVDRVFVSLSKARQDIANSDERVTYDNEEALIDAYYALLDRISPHIKRQFSRVPTTKFEIRGTHLGAHYRPGSEVGTRPGIFMVNTTNIENSPRAVGEALFLHEAIPGHHFQISLQKEADIPAFRKHLYFFAYQEGWGLYAEGLGSELGLYTDAQGRLDRAYADMVRALRLAVDTGIHVHGWSIDEAADYFEANYGHRPVNELIRYAAIPGQALTYKVGEFKLRKLRQQFKQQYKPEPDIRLFHKIVLMNGPLPLTLLEEQLATSTDTQPNQ